MPNQTLGQVWDRRVGRVTLARHPLVVGTNMCGVEIELEGTRNAYDFRSDYWEVKEDGSLRGGHEFVFRGPTGGRDLYNAVVELDTFLHNRNPDGNWRCSTHVHVDVRDMTAQQLKNLILIYTVLEKLLFKMSGIHRYKNNFCCALGFAQQQLKVLVKNWNKTDAYGFSNSVIQGWDKYSALNLLPISNFGSVEFRLSEAKWRKGKLLLLTNRFLAIKELAKAWQGSEEELIEHVVNSDIRDILPKGLPKEIHPDYRDDLMTGYKLAYDLVTFAKNIPAMAFGQRNDMHAAHTAWMNARRNRNGRDTIPVHLYVTSDSPVIRLEENLWGQVVEALRRHNGVQVTAEMLEHMNADSLRWIMERGGWNSRTIIHDVEQREMYDNWVAQNEPPEQPELNFGVPPGQPVRPRPVRAGAPRPNWAGGRMDENQVRALEAAFGQMEAQEVARRPVVEDDFEAVGEDPF